MEIELSEIPLFRGVETAELAQLFSQIVFQRKSFQVDSLVVSQGEE